MYDVKQVNNGLAMLLGIISEQESDIKAVKEDVGIGKGRVE